MEGSFENVSLLEKKFNLFNGKSKERLRDPEARLGRHLLKSAKHRPEHYLSNWKVTQVGSTLQVSAEGEEGAQEFSLSTSSTDVSSISNHRGRRVPNPYADMKLPRHWSRKVHSKKDLDFSNFDHFRRQFYLLHTKQITSRKVRSIRAPQVPVRLSSRFLRRCDTYNYREILIGFHEVTSLEEANKCFEDGVLPTDAACSKQAVLSRKPISLSGGIFVVCAVCFPYWRSQDLECTQYNDYCTPDSITLRSFDVVVPLFEVRLHEEKSNAEKVRERLEYEQQEPERTRRQFAQNYNYQMKLRELIKKRQQKERSLNCKHEASEESFTIDNLRSDVVAA